MIIFCYYVYIEAWCLGYAFNFLFGRLDFKTIAESGGFFADFVGAGANGSSLKFGAGGVLVYFLISFILNFTLIYRGVSKGIELFCKYAMPTLIVLAIIIVARMMTLSDVTPEHPERTINQGLGFMWNPVKVVLETERGGKWVETQRLVGDIEMASAEAKVKASEKSGEKMRIRRISVWEQLSNPSIWIAAAGQVFFSLTIGFGAIMTYASYSKRGDDIVLSLFDLGFKVLPLFFAQIPLGWIFGFMFFFLLFLAAVTSSLSMLQPSMAFIEEAVKIKRKFSTLLLGVLAYRVLVHIFRRG